MNEWVDHHQEIAELLLRVEPCGYPPEPERRGQDDESAAKRDEPEQDSNTTDTSADNEGPSMADLMNAEPVRTDGGRPGPNRPA